MAGKAGTKPKKWALIVAGTAVLLLAVVAALLYYLPIGLLPVENGSSAEALSTDQLLSAAEV